jgi:GTP cyclohydrolase I
MNVRDTSALLAGVMPDVQGSVDRRELPIQRVGVRALRYPLRWRGSGAEQPSVAQCSMSVALPADKKGTHMSRFIALLERCLAPDQPALDLVRLAGMHAEMLDLLEAHAGRIELRLPLFVRKTAPVSGVESLMDYEITVAVDGAVAEARSELSVLVPVTSLCPCSKSISDYGAHNQRSHVNVTVESSPPIDPVELIEKVEAQASCELYGLLKRVDEKHVTERAYDNPKFVEDLVRDVAAALRADPRITRWAVEAENFESIHNHSAFARIEG